jgi:signal peptidase II
MMDKHRKFYWSKRLRKRDKRISFVMNIMVFLLIVLVDQGTKRFIVDHQSMLPIPMGDFLSITLVYNQGVSFGFLKAGTPMGVAILCLMAMTLVGFLGYLYHLQKDGKYRLFLIFIMAGAVGNVMDRLIIGKVVDFIDIHWGRYHWPAFNVADSFIVIGTVAIGLYQFFGSNEERI